MRIPTPPSLVPAVHCAATVGPGFGQDGPQSGLPSVAVSASSAREGPAWSTAGATPGDAAPRARCPWQGGPAGRADAAWPTSTAASFTVIPQSRAVLRTAEQTHRCDLQPRPARPRRRTCAPRRLRPPSHRRGAVGGPGTAQARRPAAVRAGMRPASRRQRRGAADQRQAAPRRAAATVRLRRLVVVTMATGVRWPRTQHRRQPPVEARSSCSLRAGSLAPGRVTARPDGP